MSNTHSKVNPIEIERYLRDSSFPAHKEDLLRRARENSAPNEVMNILQKMNEQEFTSPAEVAKAVRKLS